VEPDRTSDAAVRRWLLATALTVAATVAVGGGTRLTESGLSITEWKPVTGVLPPVTGAAWTDAYEKYLQIPEAQTVHAGITLPQFQSLYWWEWGHRLVARLVGLVATVPFFVLWWGRRIRRSLVPRLALLPALVAAQGALGWYMVSSGLAVRTSVSQYRLVAHLTLALVILAIAVWTLGTLSRSADESAPPAGAMRVVGPLLGMVAVTIMSGGFVAGLDAGRIFNEFPLMGGRIVPIGYAAVGDWRNLFENPVAVQFNHRVLAMGTALAVWIAWIAGERRGWTGAAQRWLRIAAALAAVQLALGITTLLLAVPVGIAVAHQMGAVALLSALLMAGSMSTEVQGSRVGPRPET